MSNTPLKLRTGYIDIESMVAAYNNGGAEPIKSNKDDNKDNKDTLVDGSLFESEVFNHLSSDSVGEQVGVVDVSATASTTPAKTNLLGCVSAPLGAGQRLPTNSISPSISSSPSAPDGLVIDSPLELLLLIDDNILNGTIKLHDWQIQFMLDFASKEHTKDSPFQAAVQACNSSGKDKYIIAACAVWLCIRYQESDAIVTSSSGNQLDKQTAVHITRLCSAINNKLGPFWEPKYRHYECRFTNPDGTVRISTIKLFATDEPGKAEGFHPVEAGRKMALFTSETKSIPSDITDALERCIGFTHRVDASSPGLPSGYFYNICTAGIPRNTIQDIKSLNSTQTIVYKVTAYQCSHITESEIERIAAKQFSTGGRNSPIFKSSVLAEFTTTDEMVAIPADFVWNCIKNPNPVWYKEDFNTAGLDFSDGGAETVLLIRNGNKMIGMEAFRFPDTQDTINYLVEKFKFWKLNNPKSRIYGDCCGIGKPMLDSLKALKWNNVVYVDSRNAASEAFTYYNRATELFFNVKELIAKKELIIQEDKLLVEQLCTRYYKINSDNIYALLTKREQRSKGYPSPDRADAFNLCYWRYKSNVTDEEVSEAPYEEIETPEPVVPIFDLREWASRDSKPYKPEHNDISDLKEQVREYNQMLHLNSRN